MTSLIQLKADTLSNFSIPPSWYNNKIHGTEDISNCLFCLILFLIFSLSIHNNCNPIIVYRFTPLFSISFIIFLEYSENLLYSKIHELNSI